jgi:tetratricopeptide (TPR) repeat protein
MSFFKRLIAPARQKITRPLVSRTISSDITAPIAEGISDFSNLLINWNIDTQLAAVGLVLTFVQLYLADREAKTDRVAKFGDNIGEHSAKLETYASKMRKMRQEAISLQMIGHEFVTMHQNIQTESESAIIQSNSNLRDLSKVTVLVDLIYGPGFWNTLRTIERSSALTTWRFSVLTTCNHLIISNKIDPGLHPIQQFAQWPKIPKNAKPIRQLTDKAQALLTGDVHRLKQALDEDILDTQLAILTHTDLPKALTLILTEIFPTADQHVINNRPPFDPPKLNRIASFCLRAAAQNLPFSPDFLAVIQKFYIQDQGVQVFLTTMFSSKEPLFQWHAAAQLLCHASRKQVVPGMKATSAVPAGILGIIHLREALLTSNPALLRQCVHFFESAITTGPFRAYYRIYRAHAEYLRGNPHLALDDINTALKEDPNNAHGHMMKALLLTEKGELQEALQEADWNNRILENNPFLLSLTYEIMSKLHSRLGHIEQSQHWAKLAREKAPMGVLQLPKPKPTLPFFAVTEQPESLIDDYHSMYLS